MSASHLDKAIERNVRLIQSRVGKKASKTVRSILSDFGYSRRSPNNVAEVAKVLNEAGIQIEPELWDVPTIDDKVALSFEFGVSEPVELVDAKPGVPLDEPRQVGDLFEELFDWDSKQDLELFRRSFDSANSMAVFLVPQKGAFFPATIVEDLFHRSFHYKARALDQELEWGRETASDSDDESGNVGRGWGSFHVQGESGTLALIQYGQSTTIKEQARFEEILREWSIDRENEQVRLWLFFVPDLAVVPGGSSSLQGLIGKIRRYIPATFLLKAKFAGDPDLPPDVASRVLDHLFLLNSVGAAPHALDRLENGLEDLYPYIVQFGQVKREEAKSQIDWSKARFGSESEEHVLLKALASETAEEIYGTAALWEQVSRAEGEGGTRRPDISVPDEVWVEVETTRRVAQSFTDYFTTIFTKMASKANHIANYKQFWLVLPAGVVGMHPHRSGDLLSKLRQVLRPAGVSVDLRVGDYARRRVVAVVLPEAASASIEFQQIITDKSSAYEDDGRPQPVPLHRLMAGYEAELEELSRSVIAPLLHVDEYAKRGAGPVNGVLLYGPPGCGKTFIASALAQASGVQYLQIGPSDIIDQWVGSGVDKVRALFDKARALAPCVICIDEMDAIFPSRSSTLHNMHVDQKNIVNELLVRTNNVGQQQIVVIGTTNRLADVDEAAVRTGRFDKKIAIFPPNRSERAAILSFHLREHRLAGVGASEIELLARQTPLFTSSDLRAVVDEAVRRAAERSYRRLDADIVITSGDLNDGLASVANTSLQWASTQEWLDEIRRWNPRHPRLADLVEDLNAAGVGRGSAS